MNEQNIEPCDCPSCEKHRAEEPDIVELNGVKYRKRDGADGFVVLEGMMWIVKASISIKGACVLIGTKSDSEMWYLEPLEAENCVHDFMLNVSGSMTCKNCGYVIDHVRGAKAEPDYDKTKYLLRDGADGFEVKEGMMIAFKTTLKEWQEWQICQAGVGKKSNSDRLYLEALEAEDCRCESCGTSGDEPVCGDCSPKEPEVLEAEIDEAVKNMPLSPLAKECLDNIRIKCEPEVLDGADNFTVEEGMEICHKDFDKTDEGNWVTAGKIDGRKSSKYCLYRRTKPKPSFEEIANKYNYYLDYSDDDDEYVGLCREFAGLSWLDKDPIVAMDGIKIQVAEVIDCMIKDGEELPKPEGFIPPADTVVGIGVPSEPMKMQNAKAGKLEPSDYTPYNQTMGYLRDRITLYGETIDALTKRVDAHHETVADMVREVVELVINVEKLEKNLNKRVGELENKIGKKRTIEAMYKRIKRLEEEKGQDE
ncbi:MAG: hypothetical protein GY861_01820 [bacterium]|nr:hypothetical protein [bacterium]